MHAYAYLNGKRIDAASLEDRGFAFGDGVFETMRCIDGNIPLLNLHMQRLALAAQRLQFEIPSDQIQKCLNPEVLALFPDANIKLVLTRCDGRGSYPKNNSTVNLYCLVRPFSERDYSKSGIDFVLAEKALPDSPNLFGLKHLSRLEYIAAAQSVLQKGDEHVAFLDQRRNICESMHHNLFFIKENSLYAPKLNLLGVHGVMRALLLDELVASLNLSCIELDINLDTLDEYQSAFATNALDGIVKVNSIGGVHFESSELLCKIQDAVRYRLQTVKPSDLTQSKN